jgi:hypothetical protein
LHAQLIPANRTRRRSNALVLCVNTRDRDCILEVCGVYHLADLTRNAAIPLVVRCNGACTKILQRQVLIPLNVISHATFGLIIANHQMQKEDRQMLDQIIFWILRLSRNHPTARSGKSAIVCRPGGDAATRLMALAAIAAVERSPCTP